MDKLKHTPAPWVLVKSPKTNWYDLRIVEAGWSFGGIYGENAEANARLIAAAPEMLNRLLSCYISSKSLLEKEALKDTIEKATGLKIEEVIK